MRAVQIRAPWRTRASTNVVVTTKVPICRTRSSSGQIADHGLIGDLRTAALVTTNGTVDWLCVQRFDSSSVFCTLLDSERGGSWRLAPTCQVLTTQQSYFPDTNVLIARFLTQDGVVEIRDFMPLDLNDDDPRQGLVRIVKAVRGEMELRSEVRARFDYGQRAATTTAQCDGSVLLFDGEVVLRLRASVPLTVDDREVRTSFSLREVMSLHSYSTSRRRRTTKAPYVLRRRSGYSTSPSPSGESGSPKAPTAADGAKRSNGRH
jgi:hypothetical protein